MAPYTQRRACPCGVGKGSGAQRAHRENRAFPPNGAESRIIPNEGRSMVCSHGPRGAQMTKYGESPASVCREITQLHVSGDADASDGCDIAARAYCPHQLTISLQSRFTPRLDWR